MALRRAPAVLSCFSGFARPRRVAGAFLLGAAISAAGLTALAANLASAHGPFTAANPTTPTGISLLRLPSMVYGVRTASDEAPRRRHRERIVLVGGHSQAPARVASGQPVCVRLCDGYFFPLSASTGGDAAAQGAACNSLCPDAPTDVYYRTGGDRIEDSVSSHGQLYSALPVALRYRGTSDATCSCHRSAVAYAPLRDATLRRGDAIMTPAGMVVFSGAEGGAHGPRDFLALSAAGLPVAQRSALQAIERVSVNVARPSLRDWLASQSAPALAARRVAAPLVARASLKGDDRIRLLAWPGAQD